MQCTASLNNFSTCLHYGFALNNIWANHGSWFKNIVCGQNSNIAWNINLVKNTISQAEQKYFLFKKENKVNLLNTDSVIYLKILATRINCSPSPSAATIKLVLVLSLWETLIGRRNSVVRYTQIHKLSGHVHSQFWFCCSFPLPFISPLILASSENCFSPVIGLLS